jgi:glycerophosphoryl diester phosphodiesterase
MIQIPLECDLWRAYLVSAFRVPGYAATMSPDSGTWSALSLPQRGVAAHRAGATHAPENTLAALREALRLGVHQIEVDLRRTADGAIVVMHDADVVRTTGVPGVVAKLTLSELRQLDAGAHFAPRFNGERVPILSEFLDECPRDRWLNLQIKNGERIAGEVALQLVRAGRLEHAFLACHSGAAREARVAHPDVLICDLDRQRSRVAYVTHAAECGAQFVQFHHLRGVPNPNEMDAARAAGLRVNFFCAPDTDVNALFAAGVDFPLVDDVAAGLKIAERFGVTPLPAAGAATL